MAPNQSKELIRADAVSVFLAFPLLSEPNQLRVDHITALLALAVDGNTQKATIKFLAPEHSQRVAEKVWAAWETHIFPPRGHPLATGRLAKDAVMATLRHP
jgi:hypothetical protein